MPRQTITQSRLTASADESSSANVSSDSATYAHAVGSVRPSRDVAAVVSTTRAMSASTQTPSRQHVAAVTRSVERRIPQKRSSIDVFQPRNSQPAESAACTSMNALDVKLCRLPSSAAPARASSNGAACSTTVHARASPRLSPLEHTHTACPCSSCPHLALRTKQGTAGGVQS